MDHLGFQGIQKVWFWDELDRPAGRVGSLQRYETGGFDVKKEEPTRVPLIILLVVDWRYRFS